MLLFIFKLFNIIIAIKLLPVMNEEQIVNLHKFSQSAQKQLKIDYAD